MCFALLVLISVQDDGDGCENTSKDELPQPRASLADNIPSCAIEQANQEFRQDYHSQHASNTVISVYLNTVCYLISYTTLFTKLNLFKILLYVTFLTTKFSRSTVCSLMMKLCSCNVTSLWHF